jgi:hypothetical protein
MRSGGFFAGAVGGLALALLLVGVVSFLPQSGATLLAGSTRGQTQPNSALATTTNVPATTTSTCTASPAPQTPCVPGPAFSLSTNSTAVLGGLAASGNAAVSSSSSLSPPADGSAPPAAASAGKGATPQKPSSLITALPGEGVGTLLATLSPLFIGLLVAALVYGAYTRRQDAQS